MHSAMTSTLNAAANPAVNAERATFLDHASANAVGWDAFWRAFEPVTPDGRRAKQAMRPFLPGNDPHWEAALSQLRSDAAACDRAGDGALDTLRSVYLTRLPDIAQAVAALRQPGIVLSQKDLLLLKQYLFHGLALANAAEARSFAWTTPQHWTLILTLFGQQALESQQALQGQQALESQQAQRAQQARQPDGALLPLTPTFAVDHVADDAYRAAARAFAAASTTLAERLHERDEQWMEAAGVRPDWAGRLVLRRPDHVALIGELKVDPRLRWLQDTPFESLFEVVETPDIRACREQVSAAREQLAHAAEQVLARLCAALRAHLPTLLQLQADVADLDVRLAKVALLRRWQAVGAGCVPTSAHRVELVAGIHPQVAARLGQADRYVPLSVDPDPGANVLCGANMGGKTVSLSLLFICQVLAQYGLPVPAQAFRTRLFRTARFAGHAQTDLQSGLSSFGQEVITLKHHLALHAEGRAFVCLDEPMRSTNPAEGEALVVGLLRTVVRDKRDSIWFVVTHFAGAARVPGITRFRVKGLAEDAVWRHLTDDGAPARDAAEDVDVLRGLAAAMDYRVLRWADEPMPEEALRVAAWLGLPSDVLQAGRHFLAEGEREHDGRESDRHEHT